MLTMRDHDVADYAALRDMDGTDVRVLRDDDRACLDELGQYLVSTDAWNRFAIWLLHKHFEPSPGEVFVERVDTGERRTETSPAQRSGFSADELRPTSVRFDRSADRGVGVIGMEFTSSADFGSTRPLGADDEAVLSKIADLLRSHRKSDRFGVRLIRDAIALNEDELLLETCDEETRTLTCRVADTERNRDQNVETTWRWEPAGGDNGFTVVQKCYFACEPWTTGQHTRTGC